MYTFMKDCKCKGSNTFVTATVSYMFVQGVETVADRRLREGVWKPGRLESNAEGAEEEAQGRVAACPAAGSRGSTITEHPEDGPAAAEQAPAKGISGESGCDRHRLRNATVSTHRSRFS